MSAVNESINYALKTSHRMYDLFLTDLTPADYLHRPCPKANCAAWLTGHLILTDRRVLGRAGVNDLPPLPEGFEKRFSRDETAPMAWDFGDVTILRPMFAEYREKLIAAVAQISEQKLAEPIDKPSPRFSTFGEMIHFMSIHTTMHAGQISTIRRSLGRGPLI